MVGGGSFGNDMDWIVDSMEIAIDIAIDKFRNTPLDVNIVSYGSHNTKLNKLLND
jgi:hypothetical protein